MALLTLIHSQAYCAGGIGDGTTSSNWMSEPRMLGALGAIRKKEYKKAIRILKEIVSDKPDFADAWNYLGYSLRHLSLFKASEEAYLKALQYAPKHRGAHAYLGQLYLRIGKIKKTENLKKRLQEICRYGCPELDELNSAIKSYQKSKIFHRQY